VEGVPRGILRAVGPKAFRVMVENNYHTLSCLFYALTRQPDYTKEGLTLEEAKRMETIRVNVFKTVLPVLGMVRTLIARFPSETVEAKVTPEWLMRRAEKSHPEIVQILQEFNEKQNGQGWRWLQAEAEELREYFLGRLWWDAKEAKFVKTGRR